MRGCGTHGEGEGVVHMGDRVGVVQMGMFKCVPPLVKVLDPL